MPPYITAVTTILQLIISGATVVTLIYTLTKFLHAPADAKFTDTVYVQPAGMIISQNVIKEIEDLEV